MHGRSREHGSFIRMCTCSSVNRNERQTINMLSVLRNRPDISCQSALKLHFDIYTLFDGLAYNIWRVAQYFSEPRRGEEKYEQ